MSKKTKDEAVKDLKCCPECGTPAALRGLPLPGGEPKSNEIEPDMRNYLKLRTGPKGAVMGAGVVVELNGKPLLAEQILIEMNAGGGTTARILHSPELAFEGEVAAIYHQVRVNDEIMDCYPRGESSHQDAMAMSLPPENSEPVLVDLKGSSLYSPLTHRLATYWRPNPKSKEIGGDAPHWRWYEHDDRFEPEEAMTWRAI